MILQSDRKNFGGNIMDTFKKVLIWLGKIILMLGILAGLGYAWIMVLLLASDGIFGSGPSGFAVLALSAACLAVFIFICVKVSRLGTEKPDKSDSFWTKAKQPLLVIVPVAVIAIGIPVGFAVKDAAEDYFLKERAKNAVRTADEIIEYDNGGTYLAGFTILDTGLVKDTLLINYDSKTVSFIYYASLQEFEEFTLEKGEISGNQHLQYITALSSPGKTFSAYYNGEEINSHRTTGLRLEMEDGSVYSLKLDNEYLDLDTYPLINIMEAQEKADIVIAYGRNVLPSNYSGIESNTLLIDSDTKTFTMVYGDKDTISINTFGLIPTDSIEDIYLQAKIDLSIGTLYAYTGRFYKEEWEKKRTDGLFLITPDGKILIGNDESSSYGAWGYWYFYDSDYRCSEDHVNITANGIEYIRD